MEIKSFDLAQVKALDDGPAGSFEAIVAVFGNVDHGDDRMMKGSFTRTLKDAGMPPVVWSHEWQVPPIGTVTEASETDEGLLVKGRLFVDPSEDHAVAKQVYAAMEAGALKEFSFGYAVKASTDVVEDGKTIRQIEDVDLFEVGPTLKGMNPATRLVGVKALEKQVAAEIASEPAAPADPTPTSALESAADADLDKPDPKDAPVVSEEDRARIVGLLLATPHDTVIPLP